MTLLRAQREALFTIHSAAHAIEALNDGKPSRLPTKAETDDLIDQWERVGVEVDMIWGEQIVSVRNAIVFLKCIKQAELRLSAAMTTFQGNL